MSTTTTINYFVSVAMSLDTLDRLPDLDKVAILSRVHEIASGHERCREYIDRIQAFGHQCRVRCSEFVFCDLLEAQGVADAFESEFLKTGFADSVTLRKSPVKTVL